MRPFTDYYVQLKASLDERGVLGEPSETVSFKTAPFRPEPPLLLKVCGKGSDWFSLAWRYNAENGSPVLHYNVYLDKVSSKRYFITAVAFGCWENGKTKQQKCLDRGGDRIRDLSIQGPGHFAGRQTGLQ